jgi:hypothetical protein
MYRIGLSKDQGLWLNPLLLQPGEAWTEVRSSAAHGIQVHRLSSEVRLRAVLVRNVAADLAVMFDCPPDADMDGSEHCAFGNH